jgi:hypothetical protein
MPTDRGTNVNPSHTRRRVRRLNLSPRSTTTTTTCAAHQEPRPELPQQVIADDPEAEAGRSSQTESDGLSAQKHENPSRSPLPARP